MKAPADTESHSQKKTSIITHLTELRRRLIVCVIAVFAAFVVAYAFSEAVLKVLIAPMIEALPPDTSLSMIKVQEAFITHIKVALAAAVIVAFPVIMHQAWSFVLPALKKKEARVGLPLIVLATTLFAAGILFAYYGVLPYAFVFFLRSAEGLASPNISLMFYVSFCSRMLLAFGAVFQMPLVIVFLVKTGIASVDQIKKARKFAIVLIFIAAAILTPPDVLTQILMAIPLLALFEIGILIARFMVSRN